MSTLMREAATCVQAARLIDPRSQSGGLDDFRPPLAVLHAELHGQEFLDDGDVRRDVGVGRHGDDAAIAGEGHGEEQLVRKAAADGCLAADEVLHELGGAMAELLGADALLAEGAGHFADVAELAAWTSVARVILNAHETITRY